MQYTASCLLFSTAALLSICTAGAMAPPPLPALDSPHSPTTAFGTPSLSSEPIHHWIPRARRAHKKKRAAAAAAAAVLDGATSSSSGFAAHENIVSTFSPSTDISSTTASSSSSTPSPIPTSVTAATPAAPASALPLPPSVPWPQPFDQSLSYSLTGSCVAFLATWLESEEMRGNKTERPAGAAGKVGRCGMPFGLLMTSSSGWASFTRNETLLTAALSQICYPPATTTEDTSECTDYYRSLAVSIHKSSNCGTDLKNKNPVALEALYGFQNYDMLQRAACLQNNATGAYCYAEAMSPSSPPDDGYLYSLPIGIALPSTNRATCSSCSARLVNLFTETVVQAITTATALSTTGTSGNIGSVAAAATATAAGEEYYYSYASVMESALANATTILKQTCGSTFAGQITTMQAHVSSGATAAAVSPHTWSLRAWSPWSTCSAVSVSLAVAFLVNVM